MDIVANGQYAVLVDINDHDLAVGWGVFLNRSGEALAGGLLADA